jgi:outer membrane receptor protein involved in Fe transport
VNYSYTESFYTSSFTADAVGADESNAGAKVTKGEAMPDVPTQLVSFGATWNWNDLRATARGRYVGPQETADYNTGVPDGVKAPGYFIMDLGVSKVFRLPGSTFAKSVKVAVDVNNLFNKYYYNYADTSYKENYFGTLTEFASPGAPRNVVGKIEVAF